MPKASEVPNPLVSVIIPAFDAAEYLRHALSSVRSQNYESFEVIVVDDGSSDATSTIIQEYVERDSRFQLINQTNAGVGAARNAAIRQAKGKYIAPLDADDIWFPEKLEKQVACMERCGDETGLVYCWYSVIDKDGDLIRDSYPQTAEGRLRHALILRNLIGNGSVPLFRAAALEQVGHYLTRAQQCGGQGCEDWDLYLRIAEQFRIHVVPECLLAYRQTSSSMSGNARIMANSFVVWLRRARERNNDLASSLFRWSAGDFYMYLVTNCYRWNYNRWSLRYLQEAIRADPALLLTTRVYQTFVFSLLHVIIGPKGKQVLKGILRRPAESKLNKQKIDLKPKRRRRFFSNWIFENIERRRWSAALRDGA